MPIALTTYQKTILLPHDPSTSAVFEEVIHTPKLRNGLVTSSSVEALERHVAERLVRNRKACGIPASDTRDTIQRLRALHGTN